MPKTISGLILKHFSKQAVVIPKENADIQTDPFTYVISHIGLPDDALAASVILKDNGDRFELDLPNASQHDYLLRQTPDGNKSGIDFFSQQIADGTLLKDADHYVLINSELLRSLDSITNAMVALRFYEKPEDAFILQLLFLF